MVTVNDIYRWNQSGSVENTYLQSVRTGLAQLPGRNQILFNSVWFDFTAHPNWPCRPENRFSACTSTNNDEIWLNPSRNKLLSANVSHTISWGACVVASMERIFVETQPFVQSAHFNRCIVAPLHGISISMLQSVDEWEYVAIHPRFNLWIFRSNLMFECDLRLFWVIGGHFQCQQVPIQGSVFPMLGMDSSVHEYGNSRLCENGCRW